MVGDVNIFVSDGIGELEVMIAESRWRGKGLGREAIQMMLKYAIEVIGLQKFQVKISDDNTASIALFQKLGFDIVSHSNVFCEQTLTSNVKNLKKIVLHQEMVMEKYS